MKLSGNTTISPWSGGAQCLGLGCPAGCPPGRRLVPPRAGEPRSTLCLLLGLERRHAGGAIAPEPPGWEAGRAGGPRGRDLRDTRHSFIQWGHSCLFFLHPRAALRVKALALTVGNTWSKAPFPGGSILPTRPPSTSRARAPRSRPALPSCRLIALRVGGEPDNQIFQREPRAAPAAE